MQSVTAMYFRNIGTKWLNLVHKLCKPLRLRTCNAMCALLSYVYGLCSLCDVHAGLLVYCTMQFAECALITYHITTVLSVAVQAYAGSCKHAT